MEISAKTKIDGLLEEYPFLEDFLVALSPKFKGLKSPIMRKTIGKVATLSKVAAIAGLDLDDFLTALTNEINRQTGKAASAGESTPDGAGGASAIRGKAGGTQGNYQGPARRRRHGGSQTKIQSADQRRRGRRNRKDGASSYGRGPAR